MQVPNTHPNPNPSSVRRFLWLGKKYTLSSPIRESRNVIFRTSPDTSDPEAVGWGRNITQGGVFFKDDPHGGGARGATPKKNKKTAAQPSSPGPSVRRTIHTNARTPPRPPPSRHAPSGPTKCTTCVRACVCSEVTAMWATEGGKREKKKEKRKKKCRWRTETKPVYLAGTYIARDGETVRRVEGA